MPYPPDYLPGHSFPQDEQLGLPVQANPLQQELAAISTSVVQLVARIKRVTTADGKLKLDQAVRIRDVIDVQLFSGDGVTDTFVFAQPIDSAVDLVRVFVNGVRVTPTSYDDDEVVLAAPPAAGVDNVEVRIYMNMAGVLDRIQDMVADTGASLVGFADPGSRYVANSVEGALDEVKELLDDFLDAFGDVSSYVLRDGSRTLRGQWEVNEFSEVTIPPAFAEGSVELTANPTDGDTITISDGMFTAVFEFDNNVTVGVGNTAVTIGVDAEATAAALAQAINDAPLAITATINDSNDELVDLIHQIPYALGNQAIATSNPVDIDVLGMSGGVDGAFSNAYKTHFRLRNLPRSLRPGDAVVHEQLGELAQALVVALTAFLRLDGTSVMLGNLNMGNRRIRNLADATEPQNAATLAQLNAAVAGINSDIGDRLHLTGLKKSASEGTLTGPVTLGQSALASADANQTTNPMGVTVHTLAGVPRPTAPDHVANRQFVIDAVEGAVNVDDVTADATADGIGLGGGGPTTLVPGGEWFFEELTVPAAQALTAPIRIVCEGDVEIQVTGSITSAFPVEIIAGGNILINGTITAPNVVLRAAGDVTINAAINCAVEPTWSHLCPAPNNCYWQQACLIKCGATLTITANITAHDIATFSSQDTIISSTLLARWHVWRTRIRSSALGLGDVVADGILQVLPGPAHGGALGTAWAAPQSAAWRQWDSVNSPQSIFIPSSHKGPGGGGGTAGGIGGRGQTSGSADRVAPALPGNGTNRPHCQPFHDLGRGAQGAKGTNSDGMRSTSGIGGGRISVAALGNIDLTGGTLNASGGANLDGSSGQTRGGGGGGVARVVALGSITGGTVTADGGDAGAASNTGSGGGGLAATTASSYGVAPTVSAAGGPSLSGGAYIGGAGTVITETLTADQIQLFFDRGLFDLPELEPLYG